MHNDVGMGFEKSRQPVFDVGRVNGADGDEFGLCAFQGVDFGGDVVKFAKDIFCVGEHDFAAVVEHDVAPLAIKELGAKFVFDARKGVGQGRLRHMQMCCRLGDVLIFGNGDEVLELEQIHRAVILSGKTCKCSGLA